MFHAHAGVPGVEVVVKQGEEFECVVAGGVRDAEHFGGDEQGEQVVLLARGAGEFAAVGRLVELAEARAERGQLTAQAHGPVCLPTRRLARGVPC